MLANQADLLGDAQPAMQSTVGRERPPCAAREARGGQAETAHLQHLGVQHATLNAQVPGTCAIFDYDECHKYK